VVHLSNASLTALAATTLLLTRGEEGVLIRQGRAETVVPAERVTGVHTIGAGDSFLAAFVHGLVQGHTAVAAASSAARFTEGILLERRQGRDAT
jgi:sugar/nucleoside kinase (ribokinase family)